MANNVAVTAGAGTTVATDDVSGVHYQVVKLALGDEDVSTRVAAATPLPVDVRASLISVAVEFTRPADTTAYTAGDVVSDSTSATTMQAIANAARISGGGGFIVGARLVTDKKSITPRIRAHVFNTNGATIAADNVAYKTLYADEGKKVGRIDLPAMTTPTDTTNSTISLAEDFTIRVPYVCTATSLYFVLEALDGFTPANGEKFTLTVYLAPS